MTITKFIFILLAGSATAQESRQAAPEPTQAALPANLPSQPLGPGDLLVVSIYGAPELSRSLRITPDGEIRLPMVAQPIKAAGLLPSTVEHAIAEALQKEQILVDPIVNVVIAEYQSRPISVGGAVRTPVTFQAAAGLTLLQAITRAGGLDKNAGDEILVSSRVQRGSREEVETRRVAVKSLFNTADSAANLRLAGGEEVRVPEARSLFVVGNVKKPGSFAASDATNATVLKAIAIAEGLLAHTDKQAYVYRKAASGAVQEIPIDLAGILRRKAADFPLAGGDILYIPEHRGRKLVASALDRILTLGSPAAATALIYSTR